MNITSLSWRDRILVVNSVLFCVVGCGLLFRFVAGQARPIIAILGGVFLAFGVYRLTLAGRELRKRGGSS